MGIGATQSHRCDPRSPPRPKSAAWTVRRAMPIVAPFRRRSQFSAFSVPQSVQCGEGEGRLKFEQPTSSRILREMEFQERPPVIDATIDAFEGGYMRKIPVDQDALAGIFHQRMKDHPECPPDLRVEIRRVQTSEGSGWTAVTSSEDSLAHLKCARIVGALTIELRRRYELAVD